MMQFQHQVTDFVWMDGRLIRDVDLLAAPDPIALAHRLRGQFALHQSVGSEHVFVRDPLGVNKLFFSIDERGDVVSSSFWIDLVRRRHPASAIWSVPSGRVLRVDPVRRSFELTKYATLEYNDDDDPEPSAEDATRIRCALDETFERIQAAVVGRPLYVTVSGGLDSTTIAALARRHLGSFTAVTFAIHDGGDGPPRPTEDLRYATRVAAELGVPILIVHATPDDLISLLDVALGYGQDWRDFNVHCALVNAALGRAIAAHARNHGQARPVLLTGDAMNELVADYSPVSYRGRDYYPLPRMSPGDLRRFLVQGLDAGDREIGVFAHYGLDAIQPYTLCADAYAALPNGCLERAEAKQRLVREVMGDAIPSYVYERPKVRAQIGDAGEVRGTLAALVDRGIDSSWLERRFCELFELEPPQLRRAVRAGFYRFPTAYPDPLPSVSPP